MPACSITTFTKFRMTQDPLIWCAELHDTLRQGTPSSTLHVHRHSSVWQGYASGAYEFFQVSLHFSKLHCMPILLLQRAHMPSFCWPGPQLKFWCFDPFGWGSLQTGFLPSRPAAYPLPRKRQFHRVDIENSPVVEGGRVSPNKVLDLNINMSMFKSCR